MQISRKLNLARVLSADLIGVSIGSLLAGKIGEASRLFPAYSSNHIFSLSPADAECELRVPNSKGGTFLNCWTLDKKHGFRSDRTAIDNQKGIKNTLTYADSKKQLVVQVTVLCK